MGNGVGEVWVVFVPIGDVRDLSSRGLAMLVQADVCFAEAPESLRRLLADSGVAAGAIRRYRDDDAAVLARAEEALAQGARVALVSRAGGPLVSDPGWRLVDLAWRLGARVRVAPGPSAPVTALAASGWGGLPMTFHGFAPTKASARRRFVDAVGVLAGTHTMFVAARDAASLIAALAEGLGGLRRALLAREMTKTHEEYRRESLASLAQALAGGTLRAMGEMTLTLAADEAATERRRLVRHLAPALAAMAPREAAALVAAQTGVSERILRALASELA